MIQTQPRMFTHLVGFVAAIVLCPTTCSAQLIATTSPTNEIKSFNAQTGALFAFFDSGNSGGVSNPEGLAIGPDGSLYVSSVTSHQILRYNALTGTFLGVFVNLLTDGHGNPINLVFGPDRNLYVSSGDRILRYDGRTGAFGGVFVESGSGLWNVGPMVFGQDGNLYVCNSTLGGVQSHVLRFDGQTGALLGAFVADASGGLKSPAGLVFGPDGNLYVSSQGTHQVLRYDGQTGAFLNVFIASGVGGGGLNSPTELVFGPDGNLYIGNIGSSQIRRYNGSTGTFMGVFASGVYTRHLIFRRAPECRVIIQGTYGNGQALNADLHFANPLPDALPLEIKLWMDIERVGSIGLLNVGGDGTATFPAGFDQTAPFSLGTVTPSYPRGSYQIGCWLLNPVTGSVLSETIGRFTIQ